MLGGREGGGKKSPNHPKKMVTVFLGHPVSKNVFHFRGAIGYKSPIYTIRQNCASNPVCVRAVQKVPL